MERISRVSRKGQVTIPVEVRRRLALEPRDPVELAIEGDNVVIRRARSPLDESYQAVPALSRPISVEEATAIAREEHACEVAGEGL